MTLPQGPSVPPPPQASRWQQRRDKRARLPLPDAHQTPRKGKESWRGRNAVRARQGCAGPQAGALPLHMHTASLRVTLSGGISANRSLMEEHGVFGRGVDPEDKIAKQNKGRKPSERYGSYYLSQN